MLKIGYYLIKVLTYKNFVPISGPPCTCEVHYASVTRHNTLYRVAPKKVSYCILFISLLNIDQFLQFFHQ